jgi:hypothetical protein
MRAKACLADAGDAEQQTAKILSQPSPLPCGIRERGHDSASDSTRLQMRPLAAEQSFD